MNPVIDTTELAAALRSPRPPVLLDVRWSLGGPPGIDAYRDGHLPGARFCDLEHDLSAAPGADGRHPLPDPEAFTAAMRRAGVSAGVPVVAYDGGDGMGSARAWWLLRYFGHGDVRVLDGGHAAWTSEGLPTTTDEPPSRTGDFTAAPGGMPLLDADDAAALARDGVLLDVRTAVRFRGENEPVDPVAGRIPGAVNAPEGANAGPGGLLRTPDELRERFAALGVRPGASVGAYCGSGVTASHTVLVLEYAGLPGAALYAASWSGWITDPERPVATGP
ncbi:sulfurtransferase [Yinghuangia sp. ASG 101]|uniref:sulfurtransferase n=1 Tax=Yinghuangia sp. ASG 101 TaxID=2896848 RepID=UPI001E3C2052|nr:sulfurtransferase [Yinghuangia sp. ASG 101]UGQ13868.1 sulfurtransferase [Yinghuangia sp. ASG 101]